MKDGPSRKILLTAVTLVVCWIHLSIAGDVVPEATGTAALPEACFQPPPEGGDCKALFTIAYYDPDRNACDEAIYGGCGGVVPFDDLADCRTACEKGEALRLLEFRKESDRPRARLQVSYPHHWGDLLLQALVNDAAAASEVVARKVVKDVEVLDVEVHLGAGPTRMVGVELTRETHLHRAFVQVYW